MTEAEKSGDPSYRTRRLVVRALDADALDAWVEKDAKALRARTGARFPEPVEAPPLLDEDLPRIRDATRSDPARAGTVWLAVLREGAEPVGALGLAPADGDGAALVGYSVYPRHEGRGYATEALEGLAKWVRTRPQIRRLRATIPPWNAASLRVAEKAGLERMGTSSDPELGEVLVYELATRPATAAKPT